MPQVVLDTGAPKKRARLVGAGVVVLALVVIVGGFLAWKFLTVSTKEDTKAALTKAQTKMLDGKYDQAITDLKTQLKDAKTDEEKLTLYIGIGANYESKQDYPAALEAYKSGQALMETYGADMSVARMAEKTGDTATALANYQRCEAMIKDGKAKQHAGELPGLEDKINRLGGKS